ncbi:hypothetical protein [Planococcus salinus]|uniref:Uncharacterized protein n=1 Tax=Planococcus salinus TaxID=1848460 RepID=A0A3M8PAQ3_9BACL|nr:hypothetical protein [Planococcus salinus]RNF40767.1 hypothetical protein EEX84_03760 [Planococcus salinus]
MSEEQYAFYLPVLQKEEDSFTAQTKGDKIFPVSLDKINDLVKELSDFQLDTIELHITGVAKTGSLTELIIGAEGQAGMKLILNKKQQEEEQ